MTRGAFLAGCIWLASLVGCAGVAARQAEIDPQSAQSDDLYREALVSYRIGPAAGGAPRAPAAEPPGPDAFGRQVSLQTLQPAAPRPTKAGRLSIQYPHPRGLAGYALAEVVIESPAAQSPASPANTQTASAWRRWIATADRALESTLPGVRWAEGIEEAWALDIPRSELDGVLAELAEEGYFQGSERAGGEVDLTAHIDGRTVSQPWGRVSGLDRLAERVRQEGELVSYTRVPRAADGSDGPRAPEVRYGDLIDQARAQERPPAWR